MAPSTSAKVSKAKTQPIVPYVIDSGLRNQPYDLPPLVLYPVVAETYQYVKVNGQEGAFNLSKDRVYAVPKIEEWELLQIDHQCFQTALTALKEGLLTLGRYADAISQPGVSNPVTPTVVQAEDPISNRNKLYGSWEVPLVLRLNVVSHTDHMLEIDDHRPLYTGRRNQADKFLCPSEEEWGVIAGLYTRCVETSDALRVRLEFLGTYRQAQNDCRHQKYGKR